MASRPVDLLVVGLGNLPYPNTRHSVGHVVIDSLAARMNVRLSYDRNMGGLYAIAPVMLGQIPARVILLKPKPLMNILGPSVSAALRKSLKLPNTSLVALHDSLSHKPRTVSYKSGGSANGHNGIRSVISALGNQQDFHRLRLGIGREGTDVAEYVLGPLSSEERQFWGTSGQGNELVWKELENIARQRASSPG